MNKGRIKVGIQNLHIDEFNSLTDLLSHPTIEFYSWTGHDYDDQKMASCDVLILFAKKHWRYIKFKIPYLLILADFVSNKKATMLGKSRSLSITGYRYRSNNLFRGYLCGSGELLEALQNENIPGLFYPKKYPFADIFQPLHQNPISNPTHIVTLINKYKHTAAKRKWKKPANSYKIFRHIADNVSKFQFDRYGSPDNKRSFDESNQLQSDARYTIHIKYWGHVCNAVVKSLALGTPVLTDEATFQKGRYKSYLRHGKNALVFKTKEEIIQYLNGDEEGATWQKLKDICMQEASLWHFPYNPKEKEDGRNFIAKSVN